MKAKTEKFWPSHVYVQGCSEKTDTFVLLPTSLFMVQQLRNGDQMKARENAICASTNPSCRKVSCISLQHMFQMGAFSHHAQLCSLAHFLDHVAAHFWRDRLNGTGDGLLQLWNILGVVFEYSILQVPQRKKSGGVKSGDLGGHSWMVFFEMTRLPKWFWIQSRLSRAV